MCMSHCQQRGDICCCAPTHCCKRQPPKSSGHSNSSRSTQASRVGVFARAGLSRRPVGPLGLPFCLSLSSPTSYPTSIAVYTGYFKKKCHAPGGSACLVADRTDISLEGQNTMREFVVGLVGVMLSLL